MEVKVREKIPGLGQFWVFINYKGKRKAKCVGSEKAANEAAEKIQARLVLGEYKPNASADEAPLPIVTFKAYREHWLKTHPESECKYSTVKSYQSVFENHLTELATSRSTRSRRRTSAV